MMQIKVIQNENEIYQKQKLLGQGAFGKAYLVKHKQSGQFMVIKQMNIQHMSSKQKQQTIKQAQILKSLHHPNIINFKQVYITKNNKLKIVMQYAECGDIAKAITQKKNKKQHFDQAQILNWFTQICLAIKHVHDRKILHRDIKGHNIFISKNNLLKLGDFGIARVLNMTNDKARTVVGTPYYLSPQIIQNKPYSFKSDIWSIGAVLYELCALQPPFIANSLQMLALKIVKGQYPSIPSTYSQQLKNLIKQMLTLDPIKRPNINDILKKSIITDRINNFLTETKRKIQFSHTILHNQKVQIFGNKLIQIQQQRQKLKQEQKKMQNIVLQKKKEDKQKYDEIKKKQQQEKKKYQQKKRQQQKKKYQQKKKQQLKKKQQDKRKQHQQNQKKIQILKLKRIQQDKQKQYIRQIQLANIRKNKQQQQQRRRKQVQIKKINKIMQQQKKQQDFNQFARKQYFQNLQIRRRAEQRARRQQLGYYDQPSRQWPSTQQSYHYTEQNRPKSKQDSLRNSAQKKKISPQILSKNSQKSKQSQPTQQQLINKFCNPNYNKKNVNTKWTKQIKQQPKMQRRESAKQVQMKKQMQLKKQAQLQKQIKLKKQLSQKNQSKKKIQEQRQQIRKDRQNYQKNKQPSQTKQKNDDIIQVGKWNKKRSSQKRQKQQPQKDSPRFNNGSIQSGKQSSLQTTQSQDKNINKNIDDNNIIQQAKNLIQLNQYVQCVQQLQDFFKGVQKKVQVQDQIDVNQQIKQRQDDLFQLSLTAVLSKKDQQQIDRQGADLDYFSNYSKLQTLRMQLQQAFGLDNFIKLYRYIEKQVSQKGLDGFNITQAIKQVGGKIDSRIANKNGTLLLTLVTLQDKMSYT